MESPGFANLLAATAHQLCMGLLISLVLLAEPAWDHGGTVDGVAWYTRSRPGIAVNELKATAQFDATPQELWAVLTDLEGWAKTMPSTDASVIVARDRPGRTLLYLRYVLPVIATRDTLIEVDELPDLEGRWVLSWKVAPMARDAERPVAPGVVRLRVNEGLWQLDSREGGSHTFVTYQLLSAPGGDVPPFFVNRVSALGVPQTFEALRRAVRERRSR